VLHLMTFSIFFKLNYLFILSQCCMKLLDVRFKVLTLMKIQVVVFWVMIQCSNVIGYQCFRGFCCFHLYPEEGRRKWWENHEDSIMRSFITCTLH